MDTYPKRVVVILKEILCIYPPRAFRHMLRDPVGRELHPQHEFYEFPGSSWRWELQVEPPGGELKIKLFRSSVASCALVRLSWRQDVQTSPKIANKTPSWS